MKKNEFLNKLKKKINRLPKEDVKERINFYSEMIDDRMENGLNEEEAVNKIGSVDFVSEQILAEYPNIKTKKISGSNLALIIAGSPIWISLLATAIGVGISLFASLWVIIISLWGCFIAFIAGAVVSPIMAIIYFTMSNPNSALAIIGVGIALVGLAILTFYGAKYLTIKCAKLTSFIFKKIFKKGVK